MTAWVYDGGQHDYWRPVAEVSGLHATDPFNLDLHSSDGIAFPAGQHTLYLKVTDNQGTVSNYSRQIWIVDPVSASWSVGTTLPDTATSVRANLDNTSSSPISAVTFQHDATTAGEPAPADLADDLSSAEATMTFTAGENRLWAYVTLANGITYPLASYDVDARYIVDTSVAAPQDADWGELTTFHATAVSSSGGVQRGLTLHLQSRAPGSTSWVERASAVTDTHGTATLAIRAATTGTAAWRVTSTRSKKRQSSASSTHLLRVHAVWRLPANQSAQAGHTVRYVVESTPVNARARVDVQVRRTGHPGWTTLGHTPYGPDVRTVAIRAPLAGQYNVRYVVESTKTLARTVSADWNLHVTR